MNMVQYITKGFSRLEYEFGQKGLDVVGMTADLNQRDWSDEELFGFLKSVDDVWEVLKTPCEVLLGSIWTRIQSQCNRSRRGHLMRHTFGDLKGKHLMARLSTMSRVLKYWTSIEQPIEFGVPFWLYEEIADQKLPPKRAEERIMEYRSKSRFDKPICRADIAEEGEALKASSSTVKVISTIVGIDDKDCKHNNVPIESLLLNKDSILSPIIAVATNATQPVERISKREQMNTLWNDMDKTKPPRPIKTLVVDLTSEEYERLDRLSTTYALSVAKTLGMLINQATEILDKAKQEKDANTIQTHD